MKIFASAFCLLCFFMETSRSIVHEHGSITVKHISQQSLPRRGIPSWNLFPALRGGDESEKSTPRKSNKSSPESARKKKTPQSADKKASRGITKPHSTPVDAGQLEKRDFANKLKEVLQNEKAGLGIEAMKHKFKKLFDMSLDEAARSMRSRQAPDLMIVSSILFVMNVPLIQEEAIHACNGAARKSNCAHKSNNQKNKYSNCSDSHHDSFA